MGDDEHVRARERVARQRAVLVGEDLEVPARQVLSGRRVGGVLRVSGLHLLGAVAADRPRLGVGLVEQDARDFGLSEHSVSLLRAVLINGTGRNSPRQSPILYGFAQ